MSYQYSFGKNEKNQNTFQYCYHNNSSLSKPNDDINVTCFKYYFNYVLFTVIKHIAKLNNIKRNT